MIPVSDPQAGYRAHRAAIDAAMREVLEGTSYILGDAVLRFEEAFAAYIGVKHGIGVNNGTDAIHLALRAIGVAPHDEVITVAHTAVATVAAIRMAGADPVLVDIDPTTYTISLEAVRSKVGPRTKAVVAVHLYGHPAHLDGLKALCEERGLFLIEDCAQAHDAMYHGRKVGSIGHLSTFSFYPTKNLGAIGDAGMVLSDDPAIASRLRLLRQYGWEAPQHSLVEGWNSRLDPLQAAILKVKLMHLPDHTAARRRLAARYVSGLQHLPLVLPTESPGCQHVYHLFVVRCASPAVRDALREHLARNGVMTGIHYPLPVHKQQAYAKWVKTGPLEHTEMVAGTILSLPMFPELSDQDQERVIDAVNTHFSSRQ